jgi:hypothetical protein
MEKNKVFDEDGLYRFLCPHCKGLVEVEKSQINCKIFRHGYHYTTDANGTIVLQQQMNPHTPKVECDRLKENNLVIGCAKPFRFFYGENGEDNWVEICDYI